MLTKILFTVLVIVLVGAIFHKQQNAGKSAGKTAPQSNQSVPNKSLSPKALAYGLVGLLVLASIVIFALNWHSKDALVTLRVFSADGQLSEYQARQANIKGRSFTTVGGKRVQLGDSDRLEIIEAQ